VKVTVIGAGMVGATTALRLLEDRVADDLVVVDVVEGLARAVALDLCQSAPVRGHATAVRGGSDYGPTEGSDLVVVTAGLPRGPGQSRADLLAANAQIVSGVAEHVADRSPGAILIVVTNPLDEMTTLAWRVSGLPSRRVIGMAGVLDTSRFRYFVAAELGTSPDQVEAVVLGSHGETMVPVPRLTHVSGRPLTELLTPERIRALVERTRDAGAEIVALLQRGSAWFAPSASIADMAGAIARNEHRVVSACAYLEGEYGLSGVYLGVPVRLGRGGVEEIVELPLEPHEIEALRAAAETVRSRVADLEALGAEPTRSGDGPVVAGPAVDGSLADLRVRSRVRRAAEALLWERGTPPDPEMLEALTNAAVEQLARER
jgi:malate dehydrogenase